MRKQFPNADPKLLGRIVERGIKNSVGKAEDIIVVGPKGGQKGGSQINVAEGRPNPRLQQPRPPREFCSHCVMRFRTRWETLGGFRSPATFFCAGMGCDFGQKTGTDSLFAMGLCPTPRQETGSLSVGLEGWLFGVLNFDGPPPIKWRADFFVP